MKNAGSSPLVSRFIVGWLLATLPGWVMLRAELPVKAVTLDAAISYQTIDGFGANINPAQWRDGRLRPVLDQLTDDLGGSLFRFDCFGYADWLDPQRRGADGHFPAAYLREVYTSPTFRDAWATYRYLSGKGARLFLSVSGKIPPAFAGADGQTLADFDGYAEMVASLAQWARTEERLPFTLLSPFNETDLGYPEGPRIAPESAGRAIASVLARLDAAGLGDVKLVVMDDSGKIVEYLEQILKQPELAARIAVFASHTYGNGGDEDGLSWYGEKSRFARSTEKIQASAFSGAALWITEYGDLDQTQEVEFGVAWRSTRRLLGVLEDGAAAGLVWDAYDNFHKHDEAWATYGLIAVDPATWVYTPKPRYYAARQIYRFVPPGFRRIKIAAAPLAAGDVFAQWHAPLKHLRLVAFASADGADYTIVGMSAVEQDFDLAVSLAGLPAATQQKPVRYVSMSRRENSRVEGPLHANNGVLHAVIREGTIFTLTTLER